MKILGQTITDAYQEWVKDEIKSTTNKFFDFGKFIFGVSVGSIGFITGIEKYTSDSPDIYYIISIVLFVLSSILSIIIILPKDIEIKENTDLTELFNKAVIKYRRFIWSWFIIWLIAILLGLYGVFMNN